MALTYQIGAAKIWLFFWRRYLRFHYLWNTSWFDHFDKTSIFCFHPWVQLTLMKLDLDKWLVPNRRRAPLSEPMVDKVYCRIYVSLGFDMLNYSQTCVFTILHYKIYIEYCAICVIIQDYSCVPQGQWVKADEWELSSAMLVIKDVNNSFCLSVCLSVPSSIWPSLSVQYPRFFFQIALKFVWVNTLDHGDHISLDMRVFDQK